MMRDIRMQEFSVVTSGGFDFCCQDYHECQRVRWDKWDLGVCMFAATKRFVALIAEFKDDRSDDIFSCISFRMKD